MKEYKIPKTMLSDKEALYSDLERLYLDALHTHRENFYFAVGRRWEKAAIQAVISGDTKLVTSMINGAEVGMMVGDLSKNIVRQLHYYAISMVTLVTRAAIDNGMPEEEGYALSDALIFMMDLLEDGDKIIEVTSLGLLEFTRRMNIVNNRKYSPTIKRCQAYISEHLHELVMMGDLAALTGLSEGYLSVLFKEETGLTGKQYILHKKIEAAKEFLSFTNTSVQQIANDLAFASSSHFSTAFKAQTGMSPVRWRLSSERAGVD